MDPLPCDYKDDDVTLEERIRERWEKINAIQEEFKAEVKQGTMNPCRVEEYYNRVYKLYPPVEVSSNMCQGGCQFLFGPGCGGITFLPMKGYDTCVHCASTQLLQLMEIKEERAGIW